MKFIKFLILILVLISITGYSQDQSKIEGLKEKLLQSKGKEKARILNQLGWEYRLSNPDSTLFYCKLAISLAESEKDYPIVASSLNFMGIAQGYKEQYNKAYENFNKSIEYTTKHQDTLNLAHAQNNLGRLLFSHGDAFLSYDYFVSALELFKVIDNQTGMGYCYKSLSELYKSQKNYKKALEMSTEALKIREQLGNQRSLISIYQEISDIYLLEEKYDKSLNSLKKGEVIAEQIKDNASIIEIYLELANILYHQSKFGEALIYGKKAESTKLSSSNKSLTNKINLFLGKIYISLEEYSTSENYLYKVIKSPSDMNILPLHIEAYLSLSVVKEKMNDIRAAHIALRRYNSLRDSQQNIEAARAIEKLEVKIELQNKENEYTKLKSEQALAHVELSKQKNQKYTLILIIGMILVFVALVIRYTRQSIKREHILSKINEQIEVQNQKISKQNEGLEKRNTELDELNSEKDHLLNIVSHDIRTPLNNINGLSQLLESSDGLSSEQDEYVQIIKKLAKKGSDLARDLLDVNSFDIQEDKHEISQIKILEFIEEKVQEFQKIASDNQISFVLGKIDSELTLTSQLIHFSRITDNLISNAIKYSPKESMITLSAKKDNRHISLFISDQGPGFTEEDKKKLFKKFTKLSAKPTNGEASNGLGLAIVKSLTDKLKGNIELESSPNGSTFKLTLPNLVNE